MRMPSKDEILELARKMYIEDCIKHGLEPLTPEEDELKEMGYFERARLALMRRYSYGFDEERFRIDEVNYAMKVLEDNGYVVISRAEYERIMEKLAVYGLREDLSLQDVFLAEQRLALIKQRVWMEELKSITKQHSM